MFGLDEIQTQKFVERIAATAIVNQAVLKCALLGYPITSDNVILLLGDFIDPTNPEFESLVGTIQIAIEEVVSPVARTIGPLDS